MKLKGSFFRKLNVMLSALYAQVHSTYGKLNESFTQNGCTTIKRKKRKQNVELLIVLAFQPSPGNANDVRHKKEALSKRHFYSPHHVLNCSH